MFRSPPKKHIRGLNSRKLLEYHNKAAELPKMGCKSTWTTMYPKDSLMANLSDNDHFN